MSKTIGQMIGKAESCRLTRGSNGSVYEVLCGESLYDVCETIAAIAMESGENTTATFNGIEIVATPQSESQALIDAYRAEWERRHAEWIASPEYKQQQEQQERDAAAKRAALKAALDNSPPME